MKNPIFSGVCTALVTPFWGDSIHYDMLKRLLERQMQVGVQAVVLSGTTGEAATLSEEEKAELVWKAKEFTGKDLMILSGSGSSSTAQAVRQSQAAEQAGADGLLVISPYCNKASPAGLIAHYSAVCEATKLPVVAYNVPGRTGLDIPVSVYKELCNIDNFVGVKEASTDITKFTDIRHECGEDFTIWCGNDEMSVPAMAMGAAGVISVASNVWPEDMVAMTTAALEGDFTAAARLQTAMQPRIRALFCEVNPIPVKAAMKLMGYDCGPCRLPLTAPSSEHLELLKSVL